MTKNEKQIKTALHRGIGSTNAMLRKMYRECDTLQPKEVSLLTVLIKGLERLVEELRAIK